MRHQQARQQEKQHFLDWKDADPPAEDLPLIEEPEAVADGEGVSVAAKNTMVAIKAGSRTARRFRLKTRQPMIHCSAINGPAQPTRCKK